MNLKNAVPLLLVTAAVSASGCVTVNGLDVGGVNANANVKATTKVSGNTVNGSVHENGPVPTPAPPASASPQPENSVSPLPDVLDRPSPSPATNTVPADSAALIAFALTDDRNADILEAIALDINDDSAGSISGAAGGYQLLGFTGTLNPSQSAKLDARNSMLKSQGAKLRFFDEASRAIEVAAKTTPWIVFDDTRVKTLNFSLADAARVKSAPQTITLSITTKNKASVPHYLVASKIEITTAQAHTTTTRAKELNQSGAYDFTFNSTQQNQSSMRTVEWRGTLSADDSLRAEGIVKLSGTLDRRTATVMSYSTSVELSIESVDLGITTSGGNTISAGGGF